MDPPIHPNPTIIPTEPETCRHWLWMLLWWQIHLPQQMLEAWIIEVTMSEWIQLESGKEFSRLLYTNPVCLLCCCSGSKKPAVERTETSSSITETLARSNNNTNFISSSKPEIQRNVQVVSWLTAINNEGSFLCSLNRRRHTASLLQLADPETAKRKQFTLCVPVQGMEQLVLDVGSCSGSFASKFPQDYSDALFIPDQADSSSTTTQPTSLSKRQRKKQKVRFPRGIPNLQRIPFGGGHSHESQQKEQHATDNDKLFCIEGTVAHIACSIVQVLDSASEQDHFLVQAQIEAAYVDSRYWDTTKNLFRPKDVSTPPYLTFFGSQTFGYVVCENEATRIWRKESLHHRSFCFMELVIDDFTFRWC